VALSLLAAAADGKVVISSLTGKRFGVTLAAGSAAAAPAVRSRSLLASPLNASCSSPCALTYHTGGVVQHAEQIYLLFWDPNNELTSAYKSGLANWVNDLASANYSAGNPISVTQQYYDDSGSGGSRSYVPYAVQNAGSLTDTDPYPTNGCTVSGYSTCLTDAQIESEVSAYASANHKPTGLGVQYFVFTPSGVDSCFDSGATQCAYTYFCGYHNDYQPSPGAEVLYADMPYLVAGQGCGSPPALNPGGIDTVVGVFSHELAETMTDPRLDAWYDGNGDEIGDKCAYQYGTLSTTSGGLSYNVRIGSDFYYIQQEWDNRTDSCLTTDTDSQPTGSISVSTSPVMAGSPASMSASVTDPAGVAYIQWEFGDGGTGSGTSVSHTYASAGNQTVTATVTDNHGNELRLTTTVDVISVPVNHTAPTITGTAVPADVLTENQGTWYGSPTSYAYQWEQCDTAGNACAAIAGATGATYTVGAGDVGHTVRVQETASNANGPGTPATSAPTAVVVSGAPAATSAPTIAGIATQGQTLSEQRGTWSNYPASYAIQWMRCDASGASCSAISGATGQSYTLSATEVGQTVRVLETASNALGSASATSQPTGVVAPTTSGGTGGGGGSSGGPGAAVPAIASLAKPHVSGTVVTLSVTCAGADRTCVVTITLTAVVAVKASGRTHRRAVVVGSTTLTRRAGQPSTATVSLNRAGKRLLARMHRLTVRLTARQRGATVLTRQLTFKGKARRNHWSVIRRSVAFAPW